MCSYSRFVYPKLQGKEKRKDNKGSSLLGVSAAGALCVNQTLSKTGEQDRSHLDQRVSFRTEGLGGLCASVSKVTPGGFHLGV